MTNGHRSELLTDLEAVSDEGPSLRSDDRIFLLVSMAERGTQVIDLTAYPEVVVGRALDTTLPIDDARVSRRHARFGGAGSGVFVEDLGSRNGVRVNGTILRDGRRPLNAGDVVQIGPADIVIASLGARWRPATGEVVPDAEGLPEGIVVADPVMRKTFDVVRRLAPTDITVLIVGDTGAGKEVVAAHLHRSSRRASGPFVRLNCAAMPENLLESELFGHEKGAFTGADRARAGFFEAAQGGTLLLDEIGDMPLGTQAKLLRVLESRCILRLGGRQEIPIDVRILSATHRDLTTEVTAGRFRQDLLYRINTFTVQVPPLHERPGEVALLAELFARDATQRHGMPPVRISTEVQDCLRAHSWPGNVRELKNAIEHAVVLADDGCIRLEHLPASVKGTAVDAPVGGAALKTEVEVVERRRIEAVLSETAGNRTHAAARLGISRRALLYKLDKYGLR